MHKFIVGWEGVCDKPPPSWMGDRVDGTRGVIHPAHNKHYWKLQSSIDHLVAWFANQGCKVVVIEASTYNEAKRIYEAGNYPKEETTMTPDISEPLNIRRTDLIARLEENLATEQGEREEAAAKLAESKQETIDFIRENPERVFEWYLTKVNSKPESLVSAFDNGAYTPKESVPTTKENDLEKFVRVLKMSADETVSLTPQQDLYHLL